jgi:predicted deacetylase
MEPSMVVSIHDLSTVTREVVERMLEDLARVRVPQTSLLVIPDHHHKGRIDADPRFREMLQGAVSRGHEAVLHGYYHLRPARQGEGVATRLITRSYTAGEGEFYDLSRAEAVTLLRKGREALGNCGVPFTGFIAPAWLLGKEAEKAVWEEGFGYTTRIGSVIGREGRHYRSRSMVYSVRAPWRRGVSLLWNELLFHRLRNAPLVRIGLHPPDWEHEAIRHHALACIRKAASGRRVTTYGKWLDLVRASRHEEGSH